MQSEPPALFLSLKPRFAEMILSGDKTVELRRVRPKLGASTLAIFYATSPARVIVGTSRIEGVETSTPANIWRHFGSASGLTREEFDAYFAGTDRAVAIRLTEPKRLGEEISLAELRQRWRGFEPPQSFRYLDAARAASVQ